VSHRDAKTKEKPNEISKVDFKAPPVVETSLELALAPIRDWSLVHFGCIWSERFRDSYPKAEIRMPSGPVDLPDVDVRTADPDLGSLPLRCRFTDDSDNQLLHIQSNRFIRSWRATEKHPDYQHYDNLLPLFERDWLQFIDFLRTYHLSLPEIWQCEVTYINHLVRGREWESPNDLVDMFPSLQQSSFSNSHDLKLTSFAMGYQIGDGPARLQIVGQPGLRESDGKEIIQLSLTARCTPAASEWESIVQSLNFNHLAVVQNFREFTSAKLHSLWGIK